MLPTKRIETHNKPPIASHLNQHTKSKPKSEGSKLWKELLDIVERITILENDEWVLLPPLK